MLGDRDRIDRPVTLSRDELAAASDAGTTLGSLGQVAERENRRPVAELREQRTVRAGR